MITALMALAILSAIDAGLRIAERKFKHIDRFADFVVTEMRIF
jgi:hypothetical protein